MALETYTMNTEDALIHAGAHAYIDKFMGRNGKWQYVYDKVRTGGKRLLGNRLTARARTLVPTSATVARRGGAVTSSMVDKAKRQASNPVRTSHVSDKSGKSTAAARQWRDIKNKNLDYASERNGNRQTRAEDKTRYNTYYKNSVAGRAAARNVHDADNDVNNRNYGKSAVERSKLQKKQIKAESRKFITADYGEGYKEYARKEYSGGTNGSPTAARLKRIKHKANGRTGRGVQNIW